MSIKMSTMAIGLLLGTSLITGCASPLNSAQKHELKAYESKGLAVEEKNPGLAAGLGLLPGGGSFYTGNYGVAVANLLLWPLSVCWDPVSGYDGAQSINYYATKTMVSSKRNQELKQLDDELASNSLDQKSYLLKKHEIERKYSADL